MVLKCIQKTFQLFFFSACQIHCPPPFVRFLRTRIFLVPWFGRQDIMHILYLIISPYLIVRVGVPAQRFQGIVDIWDWDPSAKEDITE
jgi:hypothetical protein